MICYRYTLPLTLLIAATACAEEEPPPPPIPPVISSPQIDCGPAPASSNVDYEVVTRVSALVEDDDRDLLAVTGSINGLLMGELEDADGSLRFAWSPPSTLDPIVCRGAITLSFQARDLAGNHVELVEIITK
jgi:hypothetical protein